MPILLVVLGLSSCAGKQEVSAGYDNDSLLQTLQKVDQQQQHSELQLDQVEQRILDLEEQLTHQQTSLNAILATLEAHQTPQKSAVHVATPMMKAKPVIKKSVKDKSVKNKLVKKLAKIQSSIKLTETKHKKLSENDKLAEKNRYTAAYLALKSGRYDEAATGFQSLLNTYPSGEYADQAYYWLGESLLAKGEANAAIKAFHHLAKNYSSSSKYKAGLLKLAIAYQQASRRGDAKAVLQRLIHEFPESRTAERARSRLESLAAEQ
ncbi:MAG: tol-pal system protein YbgF [Mariprofundaceae bacterium]